MHLSSTDFPLPEAPITQLGDAEHFDGIGAWRDTENGQPIDATGVLRGNDYDGAVELADVIANDARLPACFVDKVMIYAVGRGLRGEDQPLLDRLVADFASRGHRFTALVELVATSEAFAIERRAPEVLTGGLQDGQRVPFGANLEVTALAVDPDHRPVVDFTVEERYERRRALSSLVDRDGPHAG